MTPGRRASRPTSAALAALLLPALATAITNPAYRGLVRPDAPVATVPLLAGAAANSLTGNLVIARDLLAVPGRGVPLEAFLVYSSDRRKVASPFGRGWSFSYGIRWVGDGAGNVRIVWGDGRVDLFQAAGGGAFTAPPGVFDTLTAPAPGQLMLRTKHRLEYRFLDGSHRKLTALTDPAGNALALSYDAHGRLTRITDPSGRHWDLVHDGLGRVASLADPGLSRAWSFAYDAADRLTAITDPLGRLEMFAYGADDLLVGVTDRRGSLATLTWSPPQGPGGTRLLTGIAKGGSAAQLAWDAGLRTTTVTDPNGGAWRFAYSPADLLVAATDPLGHAQSFVWGSDRTLLERTDRRGSAATFDRDALGNLTRATVPLTVSTSAVTELTWDPACNRPASFTDPRGSTWSFAYDGACNLVAITDPPPLGTGAALAYDAAGRPIGVTDRSGRTSTLAWDVAGNLAAVTDPLGHARTYEWDAGGRLAAAEDPLGNRRSFAWDALDRLVAATDALGNDETYEYDEAGNLVALTDREGNRTQWAWDALGRLAGTTDALGHADAWAYDAAGNPVAYTDRRGEVWPAAFDAAHRVISRTNPLGNTWHYAYDANGNLVTHTEASGRASTNTYDLADRLVQRDFVANRRVTFDVDASGRLLATKDWIVGTAFVYGDYLFAYDAAGRRTVYTDKLLARTVTYTWDGDGRMLTKVLPGAQPTAYGYDAAGRLASLQAFGGTGTFTYDDAGRLVAETRANGVTSSYGWDANGRLAGVTINAPPSPAPWPGVTAAGGGAVLRSWQHTRDLVGRVTATVRETGEHLAYTLDALGRTLVESGDLAALGGPYILTLAYDENGNRTRRDLTSPAIDQQRTIELNAASLVTSFTTVNAGVATVINLARDANGALTQAQRVSPPGIVPYYHDARNRLYQVGVTGFNPRTFSLDQFGRLTYTVQGSDTLRVMYGSDDQTQMSGNEGGTSFDYTCSQRAFSLCQDSWDSTCDLVDAGVCTQSRQGSPSSCGGGVIGVCGWETGLPESPCDDDLYSCRNAVTGETYELHWGGSTACGSTGFAAGGCDALENALVTDDNAAVVGGEVAAHADGTPRDDPNLPSGLGPSLEALRGARFRVTGLDLSSGAAFDPGTGQVTAPGGEPGASRPWWAPTRGCRGGGPATGKSPEAHERRDYYEVLNDLEACRQEKLALIPAIQRQVQLLYNDVILRSLKWGGMAAFCISTPSFEDVLHLGYPESVEFLALRRREEQLSSALSSSILQPALGFSCVAWTDNSPGIY